MCVACIDKTMNTTMWWIHELQWTRPRNDTMSQSSILFIFPNQI